MTSSRDKVEALLNPENIAIIGANDRPGSWTQRVWRNLQRYGFPNPVYPVNPKRQTIWDVTCYPDVGALPTPPDHLVVLVPAPAVPGVLVDAAKAGARSATIFTSGFEEAANPEAQKLGKRLRAVIEDTGLAVSGPNCLGNLAGKSKLMTITDDRPQPVAPGPVAIVGQSGGLLMAIKRTLEERGVATGYIVTSGNETGLNAADYISYFATDDDVRVIVCYLESVHDGAKFLAACRTARARNKPVVVVKLGTSAEGQKAALAHTGALAGGIEAFDAIAGAAGVARAVTLDDAIELVEYFLHAPLPAGVGLGGLTFSGGFRGLLLDAAARNGLSFPELAPETRLRLEEILTVGSGIGNPLDAGFAALGSQEIYLETARTMLADPAIDILLLQGEVPRGPGTQRREGNLRGIDELVGEGIAKPAGFVSMISYGMTDYGREFREGLPHVPFLHDVDKTVRAIGAVATYAAHCRVADEPAAPTGDGAKTVARLDDALARMKGPDADARALNEVDSKALLADYGLKTPAETLVGNVEDAIAAARHIGYPVVLKAVADGLGHKSEAGAVRLGLSDDDDVRRAYGAITASLAEWDGGVTPTGMLVAQQISGGLELVLGVQNDVDMGPVVMFGLGGVMVELYRDVAFAAPPLSPERARAMIHETRAGRLMGGFRGDPARDVDAVVDALVGLGRLAHDLGDHLQAIDVNPFAAMAQGEGGYVLDALVVAKVVARGATGPKDKPKDKL
ncbi:MAG: acetate--CoA ligase family protein [Alphaproteobacteria bacterium]